MVQNSPFALPFCSLRHTLGAACAALAFAAMMPSVAGAGGVPDCEAMAARIGAAAGLPEGLLPAIARIESGRSVENTVRAWPWTLNHAGEGLYFETRQAALGYLREAVAQGPVNIDVGCMQVNYYWHGENFPAIEAMIDPETNIRYAVQFLRELHAREGSWEAAVKNYHSTDPERGARYHHAFETARAEIDPSAVGRSDMMSVTGVAALSGREAIIAGGLFGHALPGALGGVIPYGAGGAASTVDAPEVATQSAYDALLALLAERDGEAMAFYLSEVDLAETSQSPVLRSKWTRVEAFREMFKTQP